MEINYKETGEFQKDFKRLKEKYFSLDEDFKNAKKRAIELYHVQNMDNQAVFKISGFCFEEYKIYKLKKFRCMALKGRGAQSGIRIIYAFWEKELIVDFIEIYHKNEQVNEDKVRIERYIKKLANNGIN